MKDLCSPGCIAACFFLLLLLCACADDQADVPQQGDEDLTEEEAPLPDGDELEEIEGEDEIEEEEEICTNPTIFPLLEPTATMFAKLSTCQGATSHKISLPFDEGEHLLAWLYNEYIVSDWYGWYGYREDDLDEVKTCLLAAEDCDAVNACLDESPAEACGGVGSLCVYDPELGLVAQGCTPFGSYYDPCEYWCFAGKCQDEGWMRSEDVGLSAYDYDLWGGDCESSCAGVDLVLHCTGTFENTETGGDESLVRDYRFDCSTVQGESCNHNFFHGYETCTVVNCYGILPRCDENVLTYCSNYSSHRLDCTTLGKTCYADGKFYAEEGPMIDWEFAHCVDPSFPANPCCDFEDHCEGSKILGCTEHHGGFEVDCALFGATCVMEGNAARCQMESE